MDKNGPTLACHVNMLRCPDGSYFVGHTNDLEHRLAANERGAIEGYTPSRRPVELAFSDQFSTRLEAFHRERQIKGWSRAKKEALIKGDWDGLVELSNRSSGQGSFDRLGMRGKRLRMKVLVDEDGLEDYDAIALSNQGFVSAAARKKRA